MMSKNAKIGLILFAIYTLFYAGYVGLNAFSPETMSITLVPNLNLAILYGFALIFVALLLSLLYGVLCYFSGNRQGR
jgi:uncharacterized membrane protein (DUF485 family)